MTVAAPELVVPTQTSLTSSLNPATFGQSVSFTAHVAGSSSGGTPAGFITVTVDGQSEPSVAVGALSSGVGSSVTLSQLSVGSHQITATYSGDSTFESSVSNTVVEVVSAATATGTGPVVMQVERFGFHAMPTTIVVLFDCALDSSAADLLKNYRIKGPSGRTIRIKSVTYDAAAHSVSLHPAVRLSLHRRYSLWINGSSATGLRDLSETLLDGAHSGRSGTDYTRVLTGKQLVFSSTAAAARAKAHENPSSASHHGK